MANRTPISGDRSATRSLVTPNTPRTVVLFRIGIRCQGDLTATELNCAQAANPKCRGLPCLEPRSKTPGDHDP